MVKVVAGGIAEKDDFFDRKEFMGKVWKRLEKTSLILSAPRRFGKSSVAAEMKNNPQNGNHVVFFDVEDIISADDFVRCFFNELYGDEEISSHLKKTTRALFWFEHAFEIVSERIKVKDHSLLKKEWKSIGEDIIRALSEWERPTVIIIDEFSKMLENFYKKGVDIENFLDWFRKLRQREGVRKNCRFILTGSISIQPRIQRLKITDTINDLYPLELPPFDRKTGIDFIKTLCRDNSISLPADLRSMILDLIGEAVPYFISLFIAEIEAENREFWDEEGIQDIYKNHLLSPRFASNFQHYEDRFEYLDSREADIAERMLKKIALTDNTLREEDLKIMYADMNGNEKGFREIMDVLIHDKYLKKDEEGNYLFYLKILRDWWRIR